MKKKSDGTWLIGAAFGACIGGATFGPIGFVVGMLVGSWIGCSSEKKDQEIG